MSDTHGKFIWVELMTPDTEASARFYGHVVGWKTTEMPMGDMPPYHIFEAGTPGTAECSGVGGMMTFPPEMEGKVPPNWTGYVAVDNVDETAKAFVDHGGSIRRPPDDIPNVGRFAVVADPHGAVICIMTPLPMDNPPPQLPMETPGHVGWYELYANDWEEAFAFYSKVFGWTKDHDVDMGPMGVYRIFAHNGKALGGMMSRTPDMPVACWGYYFNVDSIDEAITRVSTGGGKVCQGPNEVPGGAWIVNCLDPQGAFFSLVAPKK